MTNPLNYNCCFAEHENLKFYNCSFTLLLLSGISSFTARIYAPYIIRSSVSVKLLKPSQHTSATLNDSIMASYNFHNIKYAQYCENRIQLVLTFVYGYVSMDPFSDPYICVSEHVAAPSECV